MKPKELLELIRSRATVRAFEDRPVSRDLLVRLLEAAIRAPSPTNRQPWKFSMVTARDVRTQLVEATHSAIADIRETIAKGPHPDHLADYWGYFVRPMQSATAFVVVSYRQFPDTLAHLVRDAGADPAAFVTCDHWNGEISAASAAIMQLLLQAHAEGLGACWMSGPLLARARICELLRIRPPWRMLGGIALGWPAQAPVPTPRKPQEKVVEWFEDVVPAPGGDEESAG
ncbi:MAG: nitroreductase family protein [Deltaproteobacteria bacterium]|nr:nitroreductase family protein [Deltaproteobacteria bacterium]